MKRNREISVVDLVAQLGPNVTGYALYVYGSWSPEELAEKLVAAVDAGELGEMTVGDKTYYTAVADLLGPRPMTPGAVIEETLPHYSALLAALANKGSYPKVSDAQLEWLVQLGNINGCLALKGEQLIVTRAGLEYLKCEQPPTRRLALVGPRRARRGVAATSK